LQELRDLKDLREAPGKIDSEKGDVGIAIIDDSKKGLAPENLAQWEG